MGNFLSSFLHRILKSHGKTKSGQITEKAEQPSSSMKPTQDELPPEEQYQESEAREAPEDSSSKASAQNSEEKIPDESATDLISSLGLPPGTHVMDYAEGSIHVYGLESTCIEPAKEGQTRIGRRAGNQITFQSTSLVLDGVPTDDENKEKSGTTVVNIAKNITSKGSRASFIGSEKAQEGAIRGLRKITALRDSFKSNQPTNQTPDNTDGPSQTNPERPNTSSQPKARQSGQKKSYDGDQTNNVHTLENPNNGSEEGYVLGGVDKTPCQREVVVRKRCERLSK